MRIEQVSWAEGAVRETMQAPLGRQLRAINAGVKVLYFTGYSVVRAAARVGPHRSL